MGGLRVTRSFTAHLNLGASTMMEFFHQNLLLGLLFAIGVGVIVLAGIVIVFAGTNKSDE